MGQKAFLSLSFFSVLFGESLQLLPYSMPYYSRIQVEFPEMGKNKDGGVFLLPLLTLDNYKEI